MAKKKCRVMNERGEEVTTSLPGTFAGNRTHKIYGRLDCKSGMRMLKKNRIFFSSRVAAENAGYRPCKLCKP